MNRASVTRCGKPLVVILGSTGSGKTNLAAELCLKYRGEIVSADSMQLYRGLSIATNQSDPDQRRSVAEHLVGFLPPLTFGYTVKKFREEALRVVDDIHSRGGLPVLVGGTNYYVEAVLWNTLIGDSATDEYYGNLSAELRGLSNRDLHEELRRVDSDRAAQLHWNDRRRVMRSLQIWHSTGIKHSDLLRSQHDQDGASAIGGPLRFPNSLVLYLQWDMNCLFQRLKDRIATMVSKGLRQEITSFYDAYQAEYKAKVDALPGGCDGQPKGAFQCIGFKEFAEFLQLPVEKRNSEEGDVMFDKCVERLYVSSCQYAKRQVKWIRNRFIRRPGGDTPRVEVLQTSADALWRDEVLAPACSLLEAFLNGQRSAGSDRFVKVDKRESFRICNQCDRLIALRQWDAHVASRKHRRVKSGDSRQSLEYRRGCV